MVLVRQCLQMVDQMSITAAHWQPSSFSSAAADVCTAGHHGGFTRVAETCLSSCCSGSSSVMLLAQQLVAQTANAAGQLLLSMLPIAGTLVRADP